MYTPPAFKVDDLAAIHAAMRASRLASLVTMGPDGLIATPLPLMIEEVGGEYGVLHGHLAKANPQWKSNVAGDAMVIFMGPDAYVTPSWYATKAQTGKVVPTWNYICVHAYGRAEFYEDDDRLLDVVTRLTNLHEQSRAEPWRVTDAPDAFIRSQLKGIVGFRMKITRIDAKKKMSQNRNVDDRKGVAVGLATSDQAGDRHAAALIPE